MVGRVCCVFTVQRPPSIVHSSAPLAVPPPRCYNGPMLPNEFLRRLPEAMRPLLPPGLQTFHVQPRGQLCQWWYGPDKRIHYEIWLHERWARLELGLHFEAEAGRNEWLRRQFAERLIEVACVLGRGIEAEPWDKGWARVYETHPLWPLDEARLEEVAARAAQFVALVQPLYDELDEGQ